MGIMFIDVMFSIGVELMILVFFFIRLNINVYVFEV